MKFFKNFGIYGLVPVISKSVGFLLIPIYTSYLSVAEYGIQDIFVVFKKLAVFFIVLELYSGVGRYFYEYQNVEDRKKLVSSAFNFQLITSLLVTAVLLVFHDFFYRLLIETPGYKTAYWVVVCWIPLAGLIGFFSVIIRYDNKAKEFLYVTISQLLIRVFLTIYLVVKLNYGVLGIFIGHVVGSFIGSVGYFVLLRNYFKLVIEKAALIKILKYSLPLVPGLLIMGAQPNITRYLIRINLSNTEVGYFALAMTIVSFYAIVKVALRMTWQPFFFENAKKYPESLNHRVINIFNFFFYSLLVSTILISLFSEEIIYIIATQEYFAAAKLIGILSLAMAILIITEIASIGINYSNKTKIKSYINIIYVLIIVFILVFCIKIYGMQVVPYAFLSSSLFGFFSSMYFTGKYMKIKFQYLRYTLIIGFIITLNVFLLNYSLNLYQKAAILLLILAGLYIKRNEIIKNIKAINS